MVIPWLRSNKYAAGLLLLLRLYVGWEWLTTGWHKITAGFDATGYLNNAVAKPVIDSATKELVYPNYVSFLKHFAIPNVNWFNTLIPWGEFLVGLGLIIGVLTTAATFFGLLMNFMFMFAGTVSANPWLIMLGAIILVSGANSGKFGGDYYVLPLIRKVFQSLLTTIFGKHRPGNSHSYKHDEDTPSL